MEKINLKKQAELISEIDAMIFELYKHPFDSIEELEQSFSTSRKMIDQIVDTYDLENTSIKISISRFESCYNIKKSRIQDTLENNKKLAAKQSKQEEKMRQKEDRLNKIQQRKMEKEEVKKEFSKIKLEQSVTEKARKKDFQISNLKITENQNYLAKSKRIVKLGIVTVATAITVTMSSCNNNAITKQQYNELQEQFKEIKEQNEQLMKQLQTNEDADRQSKKNIVPNYLAFDIQNRTLLQTSIEDYVRDSLPKGIYYTDQELELQIGKLINTYYMLHIDDFDIQETFLLYGNTDQTPRKIYDDAMGQISIWSNDVVTSSVKNNTVLDLFGLDANKAARQTNLSVRKNIANIYDAIHSNDSQSVDKYSRILGSWIDSIIENPIPDSNLLDTVFSLHSAHYMKAFLTTNFRANFGNMIMSESEEKKLFGIQLCMNYTDMKESLISNTSYQQEMLLSLKEKLDNKFELMKSSAYNQEKQIGDFDYLVSSISDKIRIDRDIFNSYIKNPGLGLLTHSSSNYNSSDYSRSNRKKGNKNDVNTTTVVSSDTTSSQKEQADQKANLRKYITVNGMTIYTDEVQKYSAAFSEAYTCGSDNAVDDIEEGYSQKATRHKYDYFGYDVENGINDLWDLDKSSTIWAEFVKGYNATWSSYKEKKSAANRANKKAQPEFVPIPERVVNEEIIDSGKLPNSNSNEDVETGKLPNPDLDKENQKEQNQGNNSGTGSTEQNNTNSESEPTNNNKTDETTNTGGETSAEIGSSHEEVIENGSVTSDIASDHEISQGAESSVREALDSAGQSDVEVKVETTTGTNLSFNTFRQSFLNQLRDLRNMIVPQNNMERSMYCSNQTKTEAASYVKTLQKIEPVVSSNRLS